MVPRQAVRVALLATGLEAERPCTDQSSGARMTQSLSHPSMKPLTARREPRSDGPVDLYEDFEVVRGLGRDDVLP